jgi:peptidyl-prolyl cis-trans isomerase B (cyclophilin B)
MSKRSYERRIKAKREAERAARKRAEKVRKIRVGASVAAAVALGVILLIVFLGGNKKTPTAKSSTSPTPTASYQPVAGCTQPTPAPKPNGKDFTKAPAMTIDTNKIYVATFQTSCGTVKMRMDPKQSPKTVNSFVFLARQGFYDGTKVGRVQNESGKFAIVQAGTQTGGISGGVGYSFTGEIPPSTFKYTRGVVAMAKPQGNPPQNGSQFFFVVKDWPDLLPEYTALGKVDDADSLTSLDRMILAQGPEIQGGGLGLTPDPPIYILKVTIEELKRG